MLISSDSDVTLEAAENAPSQFLFLWVSGRYFWPPQVMRRNVDRLLLRETAFHFNEKNGLILMLRDFVARDLITPDLGYRSLLKEDVRRVPKNIRHRQEII